MTKELLFSSAPQTISLILLISPYPMPNAQCPMPNAQKLRSHKKR
ncbi:hypothetical protein [Nostoc linckia]|nr:hypothetical protein [Nostoc linckia]